MSVERSVDDGVGWRVVSVQDSSGKSKKGQLELVERRADEVTGCLSTTTMTMTMVVDMDTLTVNTLTRS